MCDSESILKAAGGSNEEEPAIFDQSQISTFVSEFVQRRDVFLQTCRKHGSPLYVVEENILKQRAKQFTNAFSQLLPEVRVYYAMKSNNHPQIAKILVDAGLNLDVSSGLELQVALDSGAKDIVFSGPGKTEKELSFAVENSKHTTVLIDSFSEIELLQRIAVEKNTVIRAGVRLTTDNNGLWRKFGIPLEALSKFLQTAKHCSHVSVRGLQFHTSWNLDPSNQIKFIARLGHTLSELTSEQRAMIEFIDIGGGFWPSQGEWLQTPNGTPCDVYKLNSEHILCHYKRPSTTIEEFARQIAQAVHTHLFPHVSCRICAEPGRWLCNDAMHLLLTVQDKKANDLVITDAGTNAIGWERFETDYFPIINLSRPELTEHQCYVLGSLCTPHDVWGYAYWGSDIQPGDVLMIPTQGAYTYSLSQEFIKPIPKVVVL
ncbi:MAG TPA: alanine racemase [Sedimentisphaerales bacterium]|nr:alanine racemase [Sedimentisphaerales bacterium]